MASQLYLFETETTPQKDGTFVVRPRRLVDGKEISVRKACGLLGFKDRETVCALIRSGDIVGWKPESKRGNGKYRVDLGSVMDYKARRKAAR